MQPSTPATADARNRAWRTAVQGIGVDLAAGTALAVLPMLNGSEFAWTPAYWGAVGLLAAKTAVLSIVAYVARLKVPPPGA